MSPILITPCGEDVPVASINRRRVQHHPCLFPPRRPRRPLVFPDSLHTFSVVNLSCSYYGHSTVLYYCSRRLNLRKSYTYFSTRVRVFVLYFSSIIDILEFVFIGRVIWNLFLTGGLFVTLSTKLSPMAMRSMVAKPRFFKPAMIYSSSHSMEQTYRVGISQVCLYSPTREPFQKYPRLLRPWQLCQIGYPWQYRQPSLFKSKLWKANFLLRMACHKAFPKIFEGQVKCMRVLAAFFGKKKGMFAS